MVSLVCWKMVAWFWGSRLDSATIMVNAASIGGVIDDQRLGAIVSKYEVLAVDSSCPLHHTSSADCIVIRLIGNLC